MSITNFRYFYITIIYTCISSYNIVIVFVTKPCLEIPLNVQIHCFKLTLNGLHPDKKAAEQQQHDSKTSVR